MSDAKWKVGMAHWGQACIERECEESDPKWKGTLINGVPHVQICPYIDPDVAALIVRAVNEREELREAVEMLLDYVAAK